MFILDQMLNNNFVLFCCLNTVLPQLNFFSADGEARGRSIGVRRPEELNALGTALIRGTELPQFAGIGSLSSVHDTNSQRAAVTGPRSHG